MQKLAATKKKKKNTPNNNRFNDAPLEKDKRNTSYFFDYICSQKPSNKPSETKRNTTFTF